METRELLQRVRNIEIKTRGLSNQIFSGHYHSAFKGRGMAFSEVREYYQGDDVRNIDWNVTARFGHPYVKVFEEERELTVMLLIDVSGSNNFGTRTQFKERMIAEIAAVLSFSAINNNDKVGVIFFSDQIEKFIPPKKGRSHTLRIIRELLDFKPQSNKTNISEALRFLTNAIKKRSTAFLLSDFIDHNYSKALTIANNKHDIVNIRLIDPAEQILPPVGLVKMQDAETGQTHWIDTSDKKTIEHHFEWWHALNNEFLNSSKKAGVDFLEIPVNKDYIKPLINLFKIREKRF
ncbi:MAG: DUF58 domain-containing protein [Bacteroidales bacterium]|nr:DUF58 domain-containing protein [Bacteroidales bacterium]